MHTHLHTFPAFRTSLRERRECAVGPEASTEAVPVTPRPKTLDQSASERMVKAHDDLVEKGILNTPEGRAIVKRALEEAKKPRAADATVHEDVKKVQVAGYDIADSTKGHHEDVTNALEHSEKSPALQDADRLLAKGIDLKKPADRQKVTDAIAGGPKTTRSAAETVAVSALEEAGFDVTADGVPARLNAALAAVPAAPAETAAPKLDAAGLKAKGIDVTKADWQKLLRTAIAGAKKEDVTKRTPEEVKALADIKKNNGVDLTDPKVRAEVEATLKGVPVDSGVALKPEEQQEMEKAAREQRDKARAALLKAGGGTITRPGGKMSPQERMAVGQIMMSTGVSLENLDAPPSAPPSQGMALLNRFLGMTMLVSSVVDRVKGKGAAVETKPLSGPEKAKEDNRRQGIEMLKGKGLLQDPNDETKFTLTADKAKFGGEQEGKALQFQFNKTSAQWEWKSDGGDWELAGTTPYKLGGVTGAPLELRKEWNKVGVDLQRGNRSVTEATEKPEEGAERRGVELLLAEKGKDGAAAVAETKEGGVRIFTVKDAAFGGKQEGQKLQFKFDAAAKQWQWKGADEAAWSPAGKKKYDETPSKTVNDEQMALRKKWNVMGDKLAGENVKAKPEAGKKLEVAEGNAAKKLIENAKKVMDKVTLSGSEKERILAELSAIEGSTSPDKLKEVRKILAPVFVAQGRAYLSKIGDDAPTEGKNAFYKRHGWLGWFGPENSVYKENWHYYKFNESTSQWDMKISKKGTYGSIADKASEWQTADVDKGHKKIAEDLLKINDLLP